jgi:kynureninase
VTRWPVSGIVFSWPARTIYMQGNSLGLMSKEAENTLRTAMDEWKRLVVKGWLEGKQPRFHYAESPGPAALALNGADRQRRKRPLGSQEVRLSS